MRKSFSLILFILIIGNIFCGMYNAVVTKSWLINSGISYLTEKPLFVTIIPVFSFIFIFIFVIIYICTNNKLVYYVNYLISMFSIFYSLYFALLWSFNTDSFFFSLKDAFKAIKSKPQIIPLESKMKCCGFKSINEFQNDRCMDRIGDQVSYPCYIEMCKRYGFNLSSSGVFLLLHLFSNILILMILRHENKTNIQTKGYGALPVIN